MPQGKDILEDIQTTMQAKYVCGKATLTKTWIKTKAGDSDTHYTLEVRKSLLASSTFGCYLSVGSKEILSDIKTLIDAMGV